MRPRSKLLTKRRLQLPTIREGSEETLRDATHHHSHATSLLRSAREQALSSQDYLLSICHLAHPTFPAPPGGGGGGGGGDDARHVARGVGGGGGGGGDQTLGAAPDPLELLYGGHALSTCWEGDSEERRRRRRSSSRRRRSGGVGGQSGEDGDGDDDDDDGDAREGRRRARANSVPRLTSPNRPPRRKGSCPEVHPLAGQESRSPLPDVPPAPEFKDCPAGEETTGARGERSGAAEKQEPGGKKTSLLAQWLSDCKSVWRVKACLLPAIAEI